MNKVWSVCCLVGAALCVQSVGGVDYIWNGGEGRWSDPANWDRSGVPGSAADDIALFPARDACVIGVESDVAVSRINADASQEGGSLSFSVASNVTLAADSMRLRASKPMECVVTGGGTFALTNIPFGVGYLFESPVHFTVSGEGTTFLMPKPAGSGLYVGALDGKMSSVDNVFRVTAGAKAIISNAVCVGQGYNIDKSGTATCSGGRLLVDDGGYLYGGLYLFIGREDLAIKNRSEAAVCAVTNATIEADMITLGSFYYTRFTGSNALVRAKNIELPQKEHAGRYQTTSFADSVFEASKDLQLMAGGRYNTNEFLRCRMSSSDWVFGTGKSWDCVTVMDGCDLTGPYYYFGCTDTSNNVTRLAHSTLTATNHVYVGYLSGAKDTQVEIDGGALNCKTMMVGKPGSVRCGVRVRGNPTLTLNEWIVGDALPTNTATRASGPWTEFVETTNTLKKLMIGAGSVGARVVVSNAAVTVYCGQNNNFTVGRDAGATGNVLRIEQGGVCSIDTQNTGKGDVYVGQYAGANGNRLEIDGGTFRYDRRFMTVGFNGSSNVLSLANGARLEAADMQLWIGYQSTAKGNRLVMRNNSVATVRMFNMQYGAVAEFAGAGNVLTVGNENVLMMDGDSFVFRPSPEAAATPVITVNKTLAYGPNRPLTVDVADVGTGVYRLMACEAGVPATDGVPVTYENLPPELVARVRRSADGKELLLTVAPKGTIILVR